MIGELPTVFNEQYPKAHKEHKCCECGAKIQVGEKYHYAKGCWDGKWAAYKTCITCDDLRRELNGYDGMPPFCCLAEWASEEGINIFNR